MATCEREFGSLCIVHGRVYCSGSTVALAVSPSAGCRASSPAAAAAGEDSNGCLSPSVSLILAADCDCERSSCRRRPRSSIASSMAFRVLSVKAWMSSCEEVKPSVEIGGRTGGGGGAVRSRNE